MDQDDEYVETQYTDASRDAYVRRAEELVAALWAHVDVVLSQKGLEREMPRYWESVTGLTDAASAFNEAEFDWCGSFPLPLVAPDGVDEEESEEPGPGFGGVVTLLGRWDFRVTDEAALVEAGRSAYLRSWPDQEREDAELRVQSVIEAVAEASHAGEPTVLEAIDGLEPVRAAINFILHDGGDDEEFDEDPFAIARDA